MAARDDWMNNDERMYYHDRLDDIRESKKLMWHITYSVIALHVIIVGTYDSIGDSPYLWVVGLIFSLICIEVSTVGIILIQKAQERTKRARVSVANLLKDLPSADTLTEGFELFTKDDYAHGNHGQFDMLLLQSYCILATVVGLLFIVVTNFICG